MATKHSARTSGTSAPELPPPLPTSSCLPWRRSQPCEPCTEVYLIVASDRRPKVQVERSTGSWVSRLGSTAHRIGMSAYTRR